MVEISCLTICSFCMSLYINYGQNDPRAKRPTGETTHLIRANRPTPKTRAKRLRAKRPTGETTRIPFHPDSDQSRKAYQTGLMPKLISAINVHKCHFVGFCFSAAHLWHFHLQGNRAPKNIMLNGPNDAFIA